MATLLTLEQAQDVVLRHAAPLGAERVPIAAAARRVLAEPARAHVDLPPFSSSAMDGYAVRSRDLPGTLALVAAVAAGKPAARALREGEAIAIATGGAVPQGADAVVPIECVVRNDNSASISARVPVGANVRPRGGDVGEGDVVARAGERLGAVQLGALAAAGVAAVVCGRRPHAVVLATGSELRAPGEPLAAGEIYEANTIMLAAALEAAGASIERLAPVPDDESAHRQALERALAADVVVTSGGVSVGPHDLVRLVARELGVEEAFWGVAVKPGKPVAFGMRGGTLVFGLPGNPVSALVIAHLLVRPALLALQGAARPLPAFLPARLALPAALDRVREQFVRARTVLRDDAVLVEPLQGQESHMIVRAAAADALVRLPRGEGRLAEGTPVRYLPIGDAPTPA